MTVAFSTQISTEPNDFCGDRAAGRNFENRDGARNVNQITWQGRAPGIHNERCAKAGHALEMAVAHHEDVDRSAEMRPHRILEDSLGSLVGRRQGMSEADPQTLHFQKMSHLNPIIIGVELEAMAIETFVAVADRGDYWSDRGELVENLIHVNIARMHHQINPAQSVEDRCGQVLAGFRDVGIRD
jgi:hypothetical protein